MMTPGLAPRPLAAALALVGAGGLLYLAYAGVHRELRQNKLPIDDWVWFGGLPVLAFVLLLLAAAGIWSEAAFGLYAVEVAVLLFLVVGIRNAWDMVLWIAEKPRG